MKENFEKGFQFVIEHEGGYVNDADDSGGETKWGISKRAYLLLDIKNLTLDEAKAIYKRDYWDKLKLDNESTGYDLVYFDSAVNCGTGWVIKNLSKTFDIADILLTRCEHYFKISTGKNIKFLRGWLKRVSDLYKLYKSL